MNNDKQNTLESSDEKNLIQRLFDSKIALAILLLMLVGPYMLTRNIKTTKVLYEFVTAVASWAVILLYARYGKLTVPVKWLLVFLDWTFVTTFFISGNTLSFYQLFLPITAISLLIELAFLYDGYNLLDAVAVFRIYIYVNLALIFIAPRGVTGYCSWLLGYRNIQSWFLIPVMTLLTIRALWKFRKVDMFTIVDIVACVFTIIKIKSSTSWVGLFVYLVIAGIAVVCYKMKKAMPRIINVFDGWVVSFAFLFGIIICKWQAVFEPIIVRILHRDITFSGRTDLWDMAVSQIKAHWLLGYGYLTRAEYSELFAKQRGYVHPHNYMLTLLMEGGVILLVIVLAGFLLAGYKLWKHSNDLAANLFVALLCSFLVMGFTEALSVYMCPLLYPMMIVSMHAEGLKSIINMKEKIVGE